MRVISVIQSPGNMPVEMTWQRNGDALGVVHSVANILDGDRKGPLDQWHPALLSIRVEVNEPLPANAYPLHYTSEDAEGTWSVYREWYLSQTDEEPVDGWTRQVSTHSTEEEADAEARHQQSKVVVTHVTEEPKQGRCSSCGNLNPSALNTFCETCERALDSAQYADIREETSWAVVLPERLAGEFAIGARRTLRHQHARLLIQRERQS